MFYDKFEMTLDDVQVMIMEKGNLCNLFNVNDTGSACAISRARGS